MSVRSKALVESAATDLRRYLFSGGLLQTLYHQNLRLLQQICSMIESYSLFEDSGMGLLRILRDRGTEFWGKAEHHNDPLYLAMCDIDHTKTKARSPQTNGIGERFHKTILNEFYQIAFRKKLYESIEALQEDLNKWLHHYNHERTHQGKMCCSRTPWQTWVDGKRHGMKKVNNSTTSSRTIKMTL